MNIIFFSFLFLIIFLIYDINCFHNNYDLNHNTNNNLDYVELNEEELIKGKKLFFESYKYYNNNILFNSPRNSNNNYTLAKYYNNTEDYKPFPNDELNNYKNSNECGESFISVISFEVDDEDYLYVLDEGNSNCSARLFKMKLNGNKIEENKIYNLIKFVNTQNILLNDFVIDKINNYAYIIYFNGTSKENNQQSLELIVVDLDTKNVQFKEIKIDFDENYVISEELNQSFPKIFSSFSKKLVSISLSCDAEVLFISPFASRKIYSISTEALRESKSEFNIKEAYKNDATLSIMASDMGNLYFWGVEQKSIFIAAQLDNDLSGFDYRGFIKKEIPENISFISKISINDGALLLTYKKNINTSYIKTGFFEKRIDEDNNYEKTYVYKCTGLIYKYDWKSLFVWIIFAIIVVFIIVFVLVENKQDLDNNKKSN